MKSFKIGWLFILLYLLSIKVVAEEFVDINSEKSIIVSLLEQLNLEVSRSGWSDELQVGVFLFNYLSDKRLQAISSSRTEMSLNSKEIRGILPDVMLDMGMDDLASRALHEEYEGKYSSVVLKLADNLAKSGEWPKASVLLDKINSLELDEKEVQRYFFLRSSIYNNKNMNEFSELSLGNMAKTNPDYLFARFNLMLSYMERGIDSTELRRFILETNIEGVELEGFGANNLVSLRDRFFITAGKYELDRGEYASAVGYLRNISKKGAYTDEALLHYGWALAKQWQFDQALQPWRALQASYAITNLNVLESIMAMAHIVELKNGSAASLGVYEYSEKKLTQALNTINGLEEDKAINEWIKGWYSNSDLNKWWSSNEDGKKGYAPESKHSIALEQLLNTGKFDEEREQLASIVKMVNWVKERYKRIEGIQARQLLEAESVSSKLDNLKSKVRRLESQAERTGPVDKTGNMVSALLAESDLRASQQELDEALWRLNEYIEHYEALPARIQKATELRIFLNNISIELARLKEIQTQHIMSMAKSHLAGIKEQLEGYLANTRLAIARLYDRQFRLTELSTDGEINE